jgi:hypothetical protein
MPCSFYDDNSNLQCLACHYSCLTCSGPGDASCLSCTTDLTKNRISAPLANKCNCGAGST